MPLKNMELCGLQTELKIERLKRVVIYQTNGTKEEKFSFMREWYRGCALAFQAKDAGS